MATCFGIGGSDGKEYSFNARDTGLTPELRRSPGEGNGYLLQCSCLENSMDRGACLVTVHGVTKSQTWLSDFHSLIPSVTKAPSKLEFSKQTWKAETRPQKRRLSEGILISARPRLLSYDQQWFFMPRSGGRNEPLVSWTRKKMYQTRWGLMQFWYSAFCFLY